MTKVQIGLEACIEELPLAMRGDRWGLLMNQASIDRHMQYGCDQLDRAYPGRLCKLFSPQHGMWGEQQANMIESNHAVYEPLDLPVFSLYSSHRRPTSEMLEGLDCFIIDLQDVGTRVYTFIWSMFECLSACAAANVPVVILDRPNPLGGRVAEGPLLHSSLRSFVGNHEIPLRHALTIGELALLFNRDAELGASLQVIPMKGWSRSMLWYDTQRTWVPPSPNMPRPETALCYPGQVLLEGTNLSEGRGTTWPFEIAGAPFLNPYALVKRLRSYPFPGLDLRPIRFIPVFDKFCGQSCGGFSMHVRDPHHARTVDFTVALLGIINEISEGQFAWLPPPYEYEFEKPPIDILFGSPELRLRLQTAEALQFAEIEALTYLDVTEWWNRTQDCLLYR